MSGPTDMLASVTGSGSGGSNEGVTLSNNHYANDPVNTFSPYGSVTYEKSKDRFGNDVWNQNLKLSPVQQYKQDAINQASLAIVNAILGRGTYTGQDGQMVNATSPSSGLVSGKTIGNGSGGGSSGGNS